MERLLELVAGLAALDAVMLVLLLVSVAVGLWRGLVFELLSLTGWVLACWLAWRHAQDVVAWLPGSLQSPWLRHLAAMALVFLGVLLATALAARLLRALIAATPLSLLDRSLGAVFGLARGLLLLTILVTLGSLTPAAASAPWRESQGVRLLTGWTLNLRLWWPSVSTPTALLAWPAHEADPAPQRAQAS